MSRKRARSSGVGTRHASRMPNQRSRLRAMKRYTASRTGAGTSKNADSHDQGDGKRASNFSTAVERV